MQSSAKPADLQAGATKALHEGGEYGGQYRQATQNLAVAERRLSAAKAKEAETARVNALPKEQVVDKVMDR